jgi:hypothetical protein
MINHHRVPLVSRLTVVVAFALAFLMSLTGTGRAHPGQHGPSLRSAPASDPVRAPSLASRPDASEEPSLALALPVVVRGPGVVVRAEAGLDALARAAAERTAAQLEQVSRDLEGLPMPRAIEIRLVKRTEDMSLVAPPRRGAPLWARGVAYPDLGVVIVGTRRAHEPIDALRVVDHELTHLALGTALDGRAPRWLDEGFAFLHASEWSMGRMQTLVGMAWAGNVASLAELERMFHGSESTVDRAYAQSYDFVAFLARRGRYMDVYDDGSRWPFQHFLAEIAAGHTPDIAARTAYGVGLGQLFGEWHEDLRQRYLLVPASLFTLSLWVLAAILLVLGYVRRSRRNRHVLDRWEEEEIARRQAAAAAAAGVAGAAVPLGDWSIEEALEDGSPEDDSPEDDSPDSIYVN